MVTDAALASKLNQLGVHFIAERDDEPVEIAISPLILLCGLANSNEARLRLALIPLFLQYPDYARYVEKAAKVARPQAQLVLYCYYTAAQLLQQKHQQVLTDLFGNLANLPPLFEQNLRLDVSISPDARLRQLAKRQVVFSGLPLNWYGTYEHAYQRLVQHTRWRLQWHR